MNVLLRSYSRLSMTQCFAGDVSLNLGLINGVDRRPHYTAPHHNGPECMSP